MERKTKYWFDTEFIEDGKTIDLLSIGIVCEDGRELYCENKEADLSKANPFVKEYVIPHLWGAQDNLFLENVRFGWRLPRDHIADIVARFVADGVGPPQFWAYYGAYDWVVLMQLFGAMVDHPEGWPMFCMDIMQYATAMEIEDCDAMHVSQEWRLPINQTLTQHHALEDARWTKEAWEFLHQKEVHITEMLTYPDPQ